jgi:pimeloyl-ACP methyl ester carboxylesterase
MEQFADAGPGIKLAYERIGDPAGDPLVLIAGLGMQLPSWPDEFCAQLAASGLAVIRFDNRDVGRSTHMRFPPPAPLALMRKRWHPEQYDLNEMADDVKALLDALAIERAHLVGASMGGMIAQQVAARYPDRVRTLTSIMSTTGARRIGRPATSTWLLMARPATTRQARIEHSVRIFRHIGSRGFPFDEAYIRELAGQSWDRDPSPDGTGRQLAAIFKSGDRTAQLTAITAPTLVIHGDRDPMVSPTGGAATARAIKGARLKTIPGMGHDLPRGAWPVLIEAITRSTDAPATS